jgi:hypothetical protein
MLARAELIAPARIAPKLFAVARQEIVIWWEGIVVRWEWIALIWELNAHLRVRFAH